MSPAIPKLNEESSEILKIHRKDFDNSKDFSIIFMGDTHIGQTTFGKIVNRKKCKCSSTCLQDKYKTLLSSIYTKASKYKNFKRIICIIHGGDGTDGGKTNLTLFRNITRTTLKYNTNYKGMLPFFANVGNHDYNLSQKTGSGHSLKNYHDIIGKDNTIVKPFGSSKGPHVAIVMLNTGYGTKGGNLGKGETLGDALDSLKSQMKKLNKQYPDVQYVLDMHIPPREAKSSSKDNHVLDSASNIRLHGFLSSFKDRIICIVCHHKHMHRQNHPFSIKVKSKSIPIYLTAQAGNCDYKSTQDERGHYGYYKIDFTKYKSTKYNIKEVSRYDISKEMGKTVVKKSKIIN